MFDPAKTIEDAEVGDIVALMDHMAPISGFCKNWDVTAAFQMPEETYNGMRAAFPKKGDLVMNRYAYLVGVTFGTDDFVRDALVVFRYDEAYICAVLSSPHRNELPN